MAKNTTNEQTPRHLWVVGALSLAWNAFGVYDFLMTTTQGETYWRASGMTDAMVEYYLAMPTWMYGPWALGVWGAFVGSILLLARSRWAVVALGLSLVGAVASLIYGWLRPLPTLPPELAAMRYMSYGIVLIAALLCWYATRQRTGGVLR